MIVTPPTAAAAGCDKTTSVSESEKLSEDSAQEGSLGSSSVKSKASGKGFLSLFTLPRRIKVRSGRAPKNICCQNIIDMSLFLTPHLSLHYRYCVCHSGDCIVLRVYYIFVQLDNAQWYMCI